VLALRPGCAPQLVEDAIEGHDPPVVHGEHGQQRPDAAARHHGRPALREPHLQGPEDAEIHLHGVDAKYPAR